MSVISAMARREFKDRCAFITGGSSGIGLGIARALLQCGARVIITGTREDRLEQAKENLTEIGGDVMTFCFDVSNRTEFARAVTEVEQNFGEIDVLCLNAGRGMLTPISTASYSDWDWLLSVNLGGVFNGIKEVVPRFLAGDRRAHIMATSSAAGLYATSQSGVYGVFKTAVVAMAENLAAELADTNISVSVYCPHLVRTNILEHKSLRPDVPEDEQVRGDLEVGMDPDEAGRRVVEGMARKHMHILSHPEIRDVLQDRFDAVLAALPENETVDAETLAAEKPTLSNATYQREIRKHRGEDGP